MPRTALARQAYVVHGVPLYVSSASAAMRGALDALLAPFAAPAALAPAPGAITVRLFERDAPRLPAHRNAWFTYPPLQCTADARYGYSAYEGQYVARLNLATGAIMVWAPPRLGIEPWMLGHAVVMPLLIEALRDRGLAALHAAALADGGRAVLLPGASGSGKSTLALALLRGGFALLADDTPFARRGPEEITLCAFAEPLNMTSTTADFFSDLAPRWRAGARDVRGKVGFAPADLAGTVADSAPAALVLFPAIGAGERSQVAPLAKADALHRLLGMTMPSATSARATEQFLLLVELVRQADCYSLTTGRDFDTLPALVRELLHARHVAGAHIAVDAARGHA
ncbi:MAG TPA: hypothetical protein VGR57_01450 [Ktedonobacterales bacterium]|nr:hypothetical protein [Ktedonobacterales bacterium]